MSKQEIVKLIQLYRNNECLWNINSKLFRRTDIKNNAYRKIATDMGADEDFIKKKIKSLRTAYTAERKKIEDSKKSGTSPDEIKEATLFYFDEMSFLDPCIVHRKGQTNLNLSESASKNDVVFAESQEDSEFVINDMEMDTPPPKKQKETLPIEDLSTTNFDDALTKFISAVNSEKENDEFQLFGLQIASQLRELPVVHALHLMVSIQQLIVDLRVRIINSPPNVTSSTNIRPPCSPSLSSPSSSPSIPFMNSSGILESAACPPPMFSPKSSSSASKLNYSYITESAMCPQSFSTPSASKLTRPIKVPHSDFKQDKIFRPPPPDSPSSPSMGGFIYSGVTESATCSPSPCLTPSTLIRPNKIEQAHFKPVKIIRPPSSFPPSSSPSPSMQQFNLSDITESVTHNLPTFSTSSVSTLRQSNKILQPNIKPVKIIRPPQPFSPSSPSVQKYYSCVTDSATCQPPTFSKSSTSTLVRPMKIQEGHFKPIKIIRLPPSFSPSSEMYSHDQNEEVPVNYLGIRSKIHSSCATTPAKQKNLLNIAMHEADID